MCRSDEPRAFAVRELATICSGRLNDADSVGEAMVRRVATIEEATEDAVTWVVDDHHARGLASCRAGAIIGRTVHVGDHPRGIVVDDPERAIADVLDRFLIEPIRPDVGVHPTAVVADGAVLEAGVRIGAHAVIKAGARLGPETVVFDGASVGASVRIGSRCTIHPRCVIYDRCEIGDRVVLHAGVVVGADGYGYIFRDGEHRKIAQIGTVVIEDDVEIGANTCVDRAKCGATRIGRGTKIDNLVQVAHNVQVGPFSILVAQVGLAGSARLGTGVIFGGRSGACPGVRVGDGAKVAANAVVYSRVAAGSSVSGVPARDHMSELRTKARLRQLPKLFEQVAELTKRVSELEAAADH